MKKALIIGDSLVQGVGGAGSRGWAQIVAGTFPQLDFRIEGVGSDTAGKVVSRWPEARFDLTILQVGTNDSCHRVSKGGPETPPDRYLKNLTRIHERFRAPESGQLLMVGLFGVDETRTTPFSPDKTYSNADLALYDALMAKFARRHDVHRVSLRDFSIKAKWLADGLHPNSVGHAWIASHVVKALRQKFGLAASPERDNAAWRTYGDTALHTPD